MFAWLRKLNTHFFAHVGAGLVAIGGAVQVPQLQPVVALFKPQTQAAIQLGSLIAIGVGSGLLYLGRPETIPADPPHSVPASPAKGNP